MCWGLSYLLSAFGLDREGCYSAALSSLAAPFLSYIIIFVFAFTFPFLLFLFQVHNATFNKFFMGDYSWSVHLYVFFHLLIHTLHYDQFTLISLSLHD